MAEVPSPNESGGQFFISRESGCLPAREIKITGFSLSPADSGDGYNLYFTFSRPDRVFGRDEFIPRVALAYQAEGLLGQPPRIVFFESEAVGGNPILAVVDWLITEEMRLRTIDADRKWVEMGAGRTTSVSEQTKALLDSLSQSNACTIGVRREVVDELDNFIMKYGDLKFLLTMARPNGDSLEVTMIVPNNTPPLLFGQAEELLNEIVKGLNVNETYGPDVIVRAGVRKTNYESLRDELLGTKKES
jgi:hypothetical protein